jgi:hypothetical protein
MRNAANNALLTAHSAATQQGEQECLFQKAHDEEQGEQPAGTTREVSVADVRVESNRIIES